MSEFAVILVYSTSRAIQAERVLTQVALSARLIPTPRHLSSDCGSAVRIKTEDRTASTAALTAAGVPIDRIENLDDS